MPMENFHSDALNRDFPLVYFASRIDRAGRTAGTTMPAAHPPVGGGTVAAPGEPVAPAEGGLTVAQVWARRASLAGNRVTVRGRVVKFNGGIMGRNWVHLQDGSGSAADGSHDLTVTTSAPATPGDVVTVTGTVVVDRDFGAGYSYKVLLEDAALDSR